MLFSNAILLKLMEFKLSSLLILIKRNTIKLHLDVVLIVKNLSFDMIKNTDVNTV